MFADDAQVSLDDAVDTQDDSSQTEIQPVSEETPPAEEQQQVQSTQEQAVLEDAVNTAEIAAQAAQQREAQLQQAMQEIEALKAQNHQMYGTLQELSKKNEEKLIEEAVQMPTLDVNGLAFATEEEVAQAQAQYANQMAEFVKSGIMKEISPFVQQAKEGLYQKEKTEMLSTLAQVPELSNINEMLPQLEKIISNNKWLQSEEMPMEEKLINAYAIARGVNAINTPPEEPKEPTTEELMQLYEKYPEFQEMIEKQRIAQLKDSQQVPPLSASTGAGNAALNIKEKPKTLDEASEATRKMFI